jgi:hypothetical protein
MFTIKIIKPGGEQQLYEVEWVAYHPSGVDVLNYKPGGTETVEFKKQSDPALYLVDNGDVYVMNSQGKTVADYHPRN